MAAICSTCVLDERRKQMFSSNTDVFLFYKLRDDVCSLHMGI